MHTSLITSIAVASLALAATLPAQGLRRGNPRQVWEHLAKTYDKNQDGVVTAAEYGRGDDKFARYDRNGDGTLTAADFAGGGGQRGGGQRGGGQPANAARIAGRVLGSADADGNGDVSRAELDAMLARLELDDAGALTPKALAALMPARAGGGQAGGANPARMAQRMARMLDADQSGAVEPTDLAKLFAAADTDRDGVLSRAELRAGQRAHPGAGPRGQRGGQRGRNADLPQVGQIAPDFELPYANDKSKTVKLSSFAGKKPVALIFGSYT